MDRPIKQNIRLRLDLKNTLQGHFCHLIYRKRRQNRLYKHTPILSKKHTILSKTVSPSPEIIVGIVIDQPEIDYVIA